VRAAASLAALLAATLVAGAAPAASTKPVLRIELETPLTVTGRSFESRERVTVRAHGSFGTRSVRVRATRSGAFRVKFRRVSGSPCVLSRLTAVGAGGSRAFLRLPPGACPHLLPPPPD
jgi:hypothetical protein